MAKRPKPKRIEDPVVRELDAIKRLLILQLYRSGSTQAEVAKSLGMDPADLSRLMPAREFTRKRKSTRSLHNNGSSDHA